MVVGLIVLVLAYVIQVRLRPNAHYAFVFDNMGENCERSHCPLSHRISLAQRAVYHDPSFSNGFSRLGNLYILKGDILVAMKHHEKAVLLDNQNKGSLLQLGIYHFNNNELDKAWRYFNHSYSIAGFGDELNYYLGRIYEKKGVYQQASWHYTRAYQFNPDNLLAFARLGAMQSVMGDKKQALDYAHILREKGNEELARSLEEYTQLTSYEEFRPLEN